MPLTELMVSIIFIISTVFFIIATPIVIIVSLFKYFKECD